MLNYVHGGSLTYEDFLQAKEFTSAITIAIDKQSQELIASREELAAEGVRISEERSRKEVESATSSTQQLTEQILQGSEENTNRVVAATRNQTAEIQSALEDQSELSARGFTVLHYDLQGVQHSLAQVEAGIGSLTGGVRELGASIDQGFQKVSRGFQNLETHVDRLSGLLDWRFGQAVARLGNIDTSLEDLLKVVKTPSQTWAYEQFEIARIAFRRGLYREAMAHVDHAINGFGNHVGFSLEPRFHYLRGTIYLTAKQSDGLFDLKAAEAAFYRSAVVVGNDDPMMASRARCAVGYVAYCQGAFQRARENLDIAKSLDQSNAEGFYLSGKLFARDGAVDRARDDLAKAIAHDRQLAVRAAEDGDYRAQPVAVDDAIAIVQEAARRRVTGHVERALQLRDLVESEFRKLPPISERDLAQLRAQFAHHEPSTLELAGVRLHSSAGDHRARVDALVELVRKKGSSDTLFGWTSAQEPGNKLREALTEFRREVLAWSGTIDKYIIPQRQTTLTSVRLREITLLPSSPPSDRIKALVAQKEAIRTERVNIGHDFDDPVLIFGTAFWSIAAIVWLVFIFTRTGFWAVLEAILLGWVYGALAGCAAGLLVLLPRIFVAWREVKKERNRKLAALEAEQRVEQQRQVALEEIRRQKSDRIADLDSQLSVLAKQREYAKEVQMRLSEMSFDKAGLDDSFIGLRLAADAPWADPVAQRG